MQNKNNSKILLVASPSLFFYYSHPYQAIPLLSGQLKQHGCNTICKDFAIEFVSDLFSQKLLDETYKKIQSNYDKSLSDFLYNVQKTNKYYKFKLKSAEHKIKMYSLYKKNNFANELYRNLKNYIKSNFTGQYSEKLYKTAFLFHLLPYVYDKNYFLNDFDFIKNYAFDKDNNFFIEYFNKKVKELPENPKLIIISKTPDNKIQHFFTLCRIIKEHYKNSKIAIGGSWFPYIKDALLKTPEVFDLFCDYITIGNGENSVVELAEYIDGKRDISDVSNLLYRNNDGKVFLNEEINPVDINKIAFANYDDFDFSKYNSERNVSVTLSKGCYWGKCNFCTFSRNVKLQFKKVSKAIEEIKYYIKMYNIKSISLTDDAIIPAYFSKFADAIIENNIKISITSFSMFDEGFTYELLLKMKKAGVEGLNFGLETNSKKVFKIANKGGNFESRVEILKNAYRAGIKTFVNLIEGLPGENMEDLIQTVKFLYDNAEYISLFRIAAFSAEKMCNFTNHPEQFGLKLYSDGDFHWKYKHEKINCDITKENSFMSFYLNFTKSKKELKNVDSGILFSKHVFKVICAEYLRKFAPDLL